MRVFACEPALGFQCLRKTAMRRERALKAAERSLRPGEPCDKTRFSGAHIAANTLFAQESAERRRTLERRLAAGLGCAQSRMT